MERLKVVTPEDMSIPFEIVNAVSKDLRSEAHFIREKKMHPIPILSTLRLRPFTKILLKNPIPIVSTLRLRPFTKILLKNPS